MILIRNQARTPGSGTSVAAAYPTSPGPMGGSATMLAFVSIKGVAATGIAASGWSSCGAAVTKNTTVNQVFKLNSASQSGTVTFSWTGSATAASVIIVELYSTQGSALSVGTLATGNGTGTSATWPSPTVPQASTMLFGFLTQGGTANLTLPEGPACLYQVNGQYEYISMFGCPSTTLPTMPAVVIGSSQDWVMQTVPVYEAAAGDVILTGVSAPTGGSATSRAGTPNVPPTARLNDVILAILGQGKESGSQATGQLVGSQDLYIRDQNNGSSGGSTTGGTIPVTTQAGDLIVGFAAIFHSAGNMTDPSGFTRKATATTGSPTTEFVISTKTAVGGDAGATATWASGGVGGPFNNWGIIVVASRSGATINIDTALANNSDLIPAASSANANEMYIDAGNGGGGGTVPSYEVGTVYNQSNAFLAAYGYKNAAGSLPNANWGGSESESLRIVLYTSTHSPFTAIRQDNEPNSTWSSDLLWRKWISGDSSAFSFAVDTATVPFNCQLISFGNVDGSFPIDDNEGQAGVGAHDLSVPPALNVSVQTGALVYIFGHNHHFGGNEAGAIQYPASPVCDQYWNNDLMTPVRCFMLGYGAPDMADSPQYCAPDASAGQAIGWSGQTIALKATSPPAYPTTQLQVNSVALLVMGSTVLTTTIPGAKPRLRIGITPTATRGQVTPKKRRSKTLGFAVPKFLHFGWTKRKKRTPAIPVQIPSADVRRWRYVPRSLRRIYFEHASMSPPSAPTMHAGVAIVNNISKGPTMTTFARTFAHCNVYPVFPTIRGLGFPVNKTPEWRNNEHRAAATEIYRSTMWTYPVWHFELPYNFLRSGLTPAELESIIGLFMATYAQVGQFLYDDPTDDTVPVAAPAKIGTGDGAKLKFQLVRNLYDSSGNVIGSEPIFAPQPGAVVYLNGTPAGGGTYNVGSTGLVTFTAGNAPGGGVTVAWSGNFWFRCQFEGDDLTLDQIFKNTERGSVKFKSIKQ